VTAVQLPEPTAAATAAHLETEHRAVRTDPPAPITAIIGRLARHLAGQPEDFLDIGLDLDGTPPFARRVYAEIRRIPPGQTRSYGEIARALDRPGAARAVGQALGHNPIPVLVPCHRVLAAGGKPGGFSAPGGLATKSCLLALEGFLPALPPTFGSADEVERAAVRIARSDPVLAGCLARPLDYRPTLGDSAYGALFTAIVHQQLTPKAAATILGRIAVLSPAGAIPEPQELLATPAERLRTAGVSAAKTAALQDLARKTLDGTVPPPRLLAALDDEEIVRRLTSIRGIGRWTVEMLLIFRLGRTDVLPADDYALRRSVASLYGLGEIPPPRRLAALGERWRPYRSAACLYFWNAANGGLA
jgi:methylated-DNA-[protein]-cysteine S-methyltransferase